MCANSKLQGKAKGRSVGNPEPSPHPSAKADGRVIATTLLYFAKTLSAAEGSKKRKTPQKVGVFGIKTR